MSCRALFVISGLSLIIGLGGERAFAQTISIFGNAVPNNQIGGDGNAVTLGVKFWSSEPGMIVGIRFYRAVASPQGYAAQLYSADGTLLGSATIAQESGPLPGWQEAHFASPISISANTTYVAAYYCSVGQGPADRQPGRTRGVFRREYDVERNSCRYAVRIRKEGLGALKGLALRRLITAQD
jgi:Domain of unknown function (DUF4082)